jgi:hypothetical protein
VANNAAAAATPSGRSRPSRTPSSAIASVASACTSPARASGSS